MLRAILTISRLSKSNQNFSVFGHERTNTTFPL